MFWPPLCDGATLPPTQHQHARGDQRTRGGFGDWRSKKAVRHAGIVIEVAGNLAMVVDVLGRHDSGARDGDLAVDPIGLPHPADPIADVVAGEADDPYGVVDSCGRLSRQTGRLLQYELRAVQNQIRWPRRRRGALNAADIDVVQIMATHSDES